MWVNIWCSFTIVYPIFFTVDFVKVGAIGLLANRTVFYNPFGGGVDNVEEIIFNRFDLCFFGTH